MSHKYNKPIAKQDKPKEAKVAFSFEFLDVNEYFNIDTTCSNWSSDLMAMMKAISTVEAARFKTDVAFRNGTYRIHNHKNAKSPVAIPGNIGVELEDMEQIRIAQSKGGIHGYLIENIFYVVWLDPLHNMYPDERYGGIKKIKPPTSCCGWRDDELRKLSEENRDYKGLLESAE